MLAGSLDSEETFKNLADLVVPRLADFCVIDIAGEDGALRQVAMAHRDLKEEPKLEQLAAYYSSGTAPLQGGARAFQTGQSEICCEVDEKIAERLIRG